MKHRLWVEVNKSADVLERSVALHPFVQPGQTFPADDNPKARYDTVTWSVPSGGAPSQQLSGFV